MNKKIVKKFIPFIFFIIGFPYCLFSQTTPSIKITGRIKGLNDGESITLQIFDSKTQDWIPIDTAIAKDEKFIMNKTLPDAPRWCLIKFSTKRVIRAVFDNDENVEIQSNPNQNDVVHQTEHGVIDEMVTVTGSPAFNSWKKNQATLESYADNFHTWEGNMQKIKDSIGFEPVSISKLMVYKDKINQDFAAKLKNITPKNLIPLFIDVYNTFGRFHSDMIRNVFQNLNVQDKNNHHGKVLSDFFSANNLAIGDVFTPFELPDTGRKIISLKSVTSKSRVTLVHFWANQSVYRTELDKRLFSIYKLYHAKGLIVIGVSADKYVEEWKEALDAQKYPWINVIDKGGKLTTNVYKEGGHRIPNTTDVLLDYQGKIIVWDPAQIELQYYLWKALDQSTKIRSEK